MKLGDVFFQGISDFWLRFFEDGSMISDLYQGSFYQIAGAYQRLLISLARLSITDAPVLERAAWHPVVIDQRKLIPIFPPGASEEDLLDAGGYLVEMPLELRDANLLCNVPINPTSTLEKDYDFEVINNDVERLAELKNINYNVPSTGHFLFFKKDPFYSPSKFINFLEEELYPNRWFGTKRGFDRYPVSVADNDLGFDPYIKSVGGVTTPIVYDIEKTYIRMVHIGGGVTTSRLAYSTREESDRFYDEHGNETHVLAFDDSNPPPQSPELLYYSVGTNAPLYNNIIDDRPGSVQVTTLPTKYFFAWANETKIESFFLWDNFGYPFSDVRRSDTEDYRTFLLATWSAYINTTSLDRVESMANLLAGYPVFRIGELSDPPEAVSNVQFSEDPTEDIRIETSQQEYYRLPAGTAVKAEVILSALELNGVPRDGRLALFSDPSASELRSVGVRPGSVLARVASTGELIDYAVFEFVWDTFATLTKDTDYEHLRGSDAMAGFSWRIYTSAVIDEPGFIVGAVLSNVPDLFQHAVVSGAQGQVIDNSPLEYLPPQFSSMTDVFFIEDEETSPGWWKQFGTIPPRLASGVSRVRREVVDAFHPNTLGNPQHTHVGDIGVLVGENDDETSDPLVQEGGKVFYRHVVASTLKRDIRLNQAIGSDILNADVGLLTQVAPMTPAPFPELVNVADDGAVEVAQSSLPLLSTSGYGSPSDFVAAGVRPGDFILIKGYGFPETEMSIAGWNTASSAVQVAYNSFLDLIIPAPEPTPDAPDQVESAALRVWNEMLLPLTALVPIVDVQTTTLTLGSPLPWGTSEAANLLSSKSVEITTEYLNNGYIAPINASAPLNHPDVISDVIYLSGQRVYPVDRVVVLRAATPRASQYTADKSYSLKQLPSGAPYLEEYTTPEGAFNWEDFSQDWQVIAPVNPETEVIIGSAHASSGDRRSIAYLLFDRIFKHHLFSIAYDASNVKAQAAWDLITGLVDAAKPLHTVSYYEPGQILKDIVPAAVGEKTVHLRGVRYEALGVVDPAPEVGTKPAVFFEINDIANPGSAQETAERAALAQLVSNGELPFLARGNNVWLVLRGVPSQMFDISAAAIVVETVDVACAVSRVSYFTRDGQGYFRATIDRVKVPVAQHSNPIMNGPDGVIAGLNPTQNEHLTYQVDAYFKGEYLLALSGLTWEIHIGNVVDFLNPDASGTLGHLFGNNVGAGKGAVVGVDPTISRHEYCVGEYLAEDDARAKALYAASPDTFFGFDYNQATGAETDITFGWGSTTFDPIETLNAVVAPGTYLGLARNCVGETVNGKTEYQFRLNPYFSGDSAAFLSGARFNSYAEPPSVPSRSAPEGYPTFPAGYPSPDVRTLLTNTVILDEPVQVVKITNGVRSSILEPEVPSAVLHDWMLGLPNTPTDTDLLSIPVAYGSHNNLYFTIEFSGENVARVRYQVEGVAGAQPVLAETSPVRVSHQGISRPATYAIFVEALDADDEVLFSKRREVYLGVLDFSVEAHVEQQPLGGLNGSLSSRRAKISFTAIGKDVSDLEVSYTNWQGAQVSFSTASVGGVPGIRSKLASPTVSEVTPSNIIYMNPSSGAANEVVVTVLDDESNAVSATPVTWWQNIGAWVEPDMSAVLGDEPAELLDENLQVPIQWDNGSNESGVGPADRLVYLLKRVSDLDDTVEYYNSSTQDWSPELPGANELSEVSGALDNSQTTYEAVLDIIAPAGYQYMLASGASGAGLYDSSGQSTVWGDLVVADTDDFPIGGLLLSPHQPVDFDWDFHINISRGVQGENMQAGGIFDATISVGELGADILNPRIRTVPYGPNNTVSWTLNTDASGWMAVAENTEYTQNANGDINAGFMPNMEHTFEFQFEEALSNTTVTRQFSFVTPAAMWLSEVTNGDGTVSVVVNAVGEFEEDA